MRVCIAPSSVTLQLEIERKSSPPLTAAFSHLSSISSRRRSRVETLLTASINMSESAALLQALAAIDQAKAAVEKELGRPADAASPKPAAAAAKAAVDSAAVAAAKAADALLGTIVSASNKPESEVSAEEAEVRAS